MEPDSCRPVSQNSAACPALPDGKVPDPGKEMTLDTTNPTRMIAALLVLALALAGTARAEAPPRSRAVAVLGKVRLSTVSRSHPEEFISFAATMTSAEKLLEDGNKPGADRLFSLAVLKGEILLDRA